MTKQRIECIYPESIKAPYRSRRMRLMFMGLFAFAFAAAFAFLATKNQDETSAANLANFRAGNIISDAVMSDYNSMTVDQIQSFLKSKNACNQSADPGSVGAFKYENANFTELGITYNRKYYFYTSNGVASAYYHVKDNKFVCLADETISGRSAAYHIWDAAQTFKINPKVLIVLLEKEQSLITDKFPNHTQYRGATGYGYPDNGNPDPRFFGFEAQIGNAANLFHSVLSGGWTNFPLGNNYIQYNPNAACGGSTVRIENLATSALYRYTPYQPNAAALSGSPDGCSAYGNRNFYMLFSDWFGSLQTPSGNTSPTNIAEGIYTISSTTNSKFSIDINNASTAEGANVQLWQNNNTIAQKFVIRKTKEGDYIIENLKSGRALTVDKNNNVVQSLYSEEKHEEFLWNATGSIDAVTFTSASTGLVLDLHNNIAANGSNIKVWQRHGTTAQRFKLNLVAKTATVNTDQNKDGKLDSFIIASKVTNDNKHVLDVNQAGKSNGVNVQLWGANNTSAQKFKLEPLGNGFYRIIASTGTSAKGNPMVLDVYLASDALGTNVHIWEWNNTIAQQWMLTQNADNTYSLVSRCNARVLDIKERRIDNGTNAQIWEANNTPAQKFSLIVK